MKIAIFSAVFFFLGLVFMVEAHMANERLSMLELCKSLEDFQYKGDSRSFRQWLGDQHTHVYNPIDVAVCLYERTGK